MIWACNQHYFFAVKNWIQNKKPVQIETSILGFNQGEVATSAWHEAPVSSVGDHLLSEDKERTSGRTASTNAARTRILVKQYSPKTVR